ncbi:uncharacterized protein [Apostichopus japonicus]|uniref:uncharacterized protein isoform X2 n=1 Tax=Stichopus japonicus TaxID=307972 RepID=UPI003AB3B369
MNICIVLGLFCFFHCLICINGRCVQSDYDNRNITAVVGQNVTFKCVQLAGCPRYVWRIFPANAIPHVDILDDMCNTNYKVCATENRNGQKVLRLTDVSENSAEYYQCTCAIEYRPPTAFSCNQLIVVCQAQVTVGDLFMTFNGSHTGSKETSVIDIPEDELVQVNCLGLSTFTTSCSEGSSTFTATRYHNNCIILCQSANGCTTKIMMNVLNRETTTTSSTHHRASTEAAVHHTATHIASTKAGTSYSKEQMSDACNCIPVVAVLLVSVSILVLGVGALSIYIRYLKTNGFPKPVLTNKAIFLQPGDATVSTYVNTDAGKATLCHTCVPNTEVMVSPMSITDNHEANCSASKRNVPNCDASGYEIPQNMDCTNEIKYETINEGGIKLTSSQTVDIKACRYDRYKLK